MSARWPSVSIGSAARRVSRDHGQLFFAAGFYTIVASVLAALWRAAAEVNGGNVAGYSGLQLTWYVMASEAVTIALNVRLIEVIGDDIASGAVAAELLRPAPVLGVRVCTEFGRCLPRLTVCVAIGAVLASATAGAPYDPSALALAIPALVLAVTCNLVAQHAFAGIAFWLRDARSMWFLYHKLVFVLGGMLLPLQVMPSWLHTIASWLPFAAMAYVPARLASGHFEPQLLLVQVGWLAVLWWAARAVFTAGERRLQVVGG